MDHRARIEIDCITRDSATVPSGMQIADSTLTATLTERPSLDVSQKYLRIGTATRHLGELEEARQERRDGAGEHQQRPDDEAGRPPAVAAARQLHAACDMMQGSIRAYPLLAGAPKT